MKEKIEKWLDGYIAAMEAHMNYPNLDDECITLCTRTNYIHLFSGFDIVTQVLGLDVIKEEEVSAFSGKRYIHKSAIYKGYEICSAKEVEND